MDKDILNKYQPVIGLEIHAQLATKSKIFCGDSTEFGNKPNTNVSAISLAHPGTLPVLNEAVVELAVRMGLALGCEITREIIFDRKHYFYPDSPKGYQITQDNTPICIGGSLEISLSKGGTRVVKFNRIHLEDDAGKSVHNDNEKDTQIDLNRAGIPLIEMVTEPDINTAEEAATVLTEIRKIVRYLNVCDGNMEQGSLRCDANVSVRLKESTTLGKKAEIKNMNSIRNVQKAVNYEIKRQIALLEEGKEVLQETRLFDAAKGTTSGMREKEEATDYRYFPDPDLSPFVITESVITEIKLNMPDLPSELKLKFIEEYGLPVYDAGVITDSKILAFYLEGLVNKGIDPKKGSNWLMGPVKSKLNEFKGTHDDFPLTSQRLAILIGLVESGKVSYTAASQQLLEAVIENQLDAPDQLAEKMGLIQESNANALQPIIDSVLANNADKVKAYKNGKKGLMGMFMGEVMKQSKGSADPAVATKLLKEALS